MGTLRRVAERSLNGSFGERAWRARSHAYALPSSFLKLAEVAGAALSKDQRDVLIDTGLCAVSGGRTVSRACPRLSWS